MMSPIRSSIVDVRANATEAPALNLSSSSLDFGRVEVGESEQLELQIRTVSQGSLNLQSLALTITQELRDPFDPS